MPAFRVGNWSMAGTGTHLVSQWSIRQLGSSQKPLAIWIRHQWRWWHPSAEQWWAHSWCGSGSLPLIGFHFSCLHTLRKSGWRLGQSFTSRCQCTPQHAEAEAPAWTRQSPGIGRGNLARAAESGSFRADPVLFLAPPLWIELAVVKHTLWHCYRAGVYTVWLPRHSTVRRSEGRATRASWVFCSWAMACSPPGSWRSPSAAWHHWPLRAGTQPDARPRPADLDAWQSEPHQPSPHQPRSGQSPSSYPAF